MSEQVLAHRVGGATYQAIAMLHDISVAKARYICRRAAMSGTVTPEQIGWTRKPKPLRIPPERYNDHWMKRVLAQVKQDENGCWLWQGSLHPKGYGQTNYRRRTVRVHRTMYEIVNGPVPDGLLVCHSCDTRRCCHPSHLFVGTEKDNNNDCARKGRHHNAVKTECKFGHPFDAENTYNAKGGLRHCRECQRERYRRLWREEPELMKKKQQAYRARRKQAVA